METMMDQVAIISDLHGNIPALEATLNDIKRRNIKRIFCLGDLVGKGPHSDKAVDICQDVCETFQHQTLFNTGSVGNPLDITQASYAILEGTYGSECADTFSVRLIRVPYDIELAIKQAADENMPSLEPYANELRTATYRGAVA